MTPRFAVSLALAMSIAPLTSAQDPSPHDAAKPMVELPSEEGQALLTHAPSADRQLLMDNWVAQLRSHCGAASAVVVMNSLQEGEGHTQDGLFTDETAHIITQDVVYRIGFTLEELHDMIETVSGLDVEWRRAGTEEGQHGYEDFMADLRATMADPDQRMIINLSTASLRGEGTGGGHFSPLADYLEEEDQVLVLEINSNREIYWVGSEDLYTSIETIDPVCGLNRGWLLVRR